MKIIVGILAAQLLLVTAGCGATEGASVDGAEPAADEDSNIGTVTEKFVNTDLTEFTWVIGQPITWMQHSSTHVCALTGVAGKLNHAMDIVEVWVDENNGFYALGGNSGSNSVISARGICVPRSRFIKPQGWDNVSGNFYIQGSPNGNWNVGQTSTYQGDAASWLTGVGGVWNGTAESAFIVNASTPTANSQLSIWAANPGSFVRAWAASYFAGYAQAQLYKKYGGSWGASQPNSPMADMAPTSAAFCFLTGLTGKFRTYSDSAMLRPAITGEVWRLSVGVGSTSGTDKPAAYANCMKYDQR